MGLGTILEVVLNHGLDFYILHNFRIGSHSQNKNTTQFFLFFLSWNEFLSYLPRCAGIAIFFRVRMASNKFIIYFLYLPIEHAHGYPRQALLDQLPFCACVQGGDSHTPCDHDFVINREKNQKGQKSWSVQQSKRWKLLNSSKRYMLANCPFLSI